METFKEEPVAKRLRSKIVYMKTSEEEPVAKRLRSKIANIKTSKGEPVTKRPQIEPQNDKEIIQFQWQVIENQKERIRQLEEQLKIQLPPGWEMRYNSFGRLYYVDLTNRSTTWERPQPVPKLPNEIWLEIMSYLSTYDVLRNIACVSKKFHQLSKDRYLIRQIQLDYESWPENKIDEYVKQGIPKVIKRSHNLTFISFNFAVKFGVNKSGLSLFVWALRILNRYCPKLKIIKLDFMPLRWNSDIWKYLSELQETIISLEPNNSIEEFEMIGFHIDVDKACFKKVLETFTEKFPKLQRLCLATDLMDMQKLDSDYEPLEKWDKYAEICQEFALAKSIKLEIRGLPEGFFTMRPRIVKVTRTRPSEKLEKFPVQKK